MKPPMRIWARSLLALCNTLLALAMFGLAIIAFASGREHYVGSSVWFRVIPCLMFVALFGVLTHNAAKRRGRVLQTVVSVGALGLAMMTDWWSTPTLYGVSSLLIVWWLGDYESSGPTPAKRLPGTPHEVARFMWRRGDSYDAIRAELSARQLPADEIEKLVYELAVEEEARQRTTPPT